MRRAGGRRDYTLTARGLAALRAWIGPPLTGEAVSVTHDPLRSRARFLGALAAAERRRWVAGALEALEQVERRVAAWHEVHATAGDPFAELMTAHAQLDLAFRRAWLEKVRAATNGVRVKKFSRGASEGATAGYRGVPKRRKQRRSEQG